jgi:hypothetical protein
MTRSLANVCRFTIDRTQFARLERALSIAVSAAQSMSADTGIFWLRDSLFAATPYASIGLVNFDYELQRDREKVPSCIAISQLVARRLLAELRSCRTRHLERIGLVLDRDEVIFTFDYDRESELKRHPLASRYLGAWMPQITPREHCERLSAYRPRFDCVLPIEEMSERLRDHEGVWSFSGVYGSCEFDIRSGYVALEESSSAVTYVTVSRSLLLAFLDAAKDEDTTFQFRYYGDQRSVVCSAGDVVGILSVIG